MAHALIRCLLGLNNKYRINVFLGFGSKLIPTLTKAFKVRNHHLKDNNIDVTKLLTINEVTEELIKEMGIERGYSRHPKSRAYLLPLLPKSQDELPHRTMKDSFSMAVIPLANDAALQEKYVSVHGRVRNGRLLEALDLFAVWVAHRYILNPKRGPEDNAPFVIVTVSVDDISFAEQKDRYMHDIILSGHVSWVGKTSLEIRVWANQIVSNNVDQITEATFLMAARDATLTHSTFVNPLVAENDEEKEIIRSGEIRKERRYHSQQESNLRIVPNEEEQNVIHDLFLHTVDPKDPTINKRVLPPFSVWMHEAKYYNLLNSYPEDRNMHNKVFGGFMMRQALSLAHYSASLYSEDRPHLKHICDVFFKNSVDIGSLIKMHAHVVYTEKNCMQIAVYADAYNSIMHQPYSASHSSSLLYFLMM